MLAILLNNSCASLPPVPKGTIYILDEATQIAYGSDIPSSVLGKPSIQTKVSFKNMDKWICFDPNSWTNIQGYIQKLTVVAKAQCQP